MRVTLAQRNGSALLPLFCAHMAREMLLNQGPPITVPPFHATGRSDGQAIYLSGEEESRSHPVCRPFRTPAGSAQGLLKKFPRDLKQLGEWPAQGAPIQTLWGRPHPFAIHGIGIEICGSRIGGRPCLWQVWWGTLEKISDKTST